MCVIAVYKTIRPNLEDLQKMECKNNDGGSIAWFTEDGKCSYVKNLTAKEIMIQSEMVPLPFVIHFRLASRGGVDALLCHPFEITETCELKLAGNSDKLLFHNGSFSDYRICHSAAGFEEPPISAPFSDTLAIAKIISRHKDEKFLGKVGGYFAVMEAKNKDIRTFGWFDKEEGVHYSNLYWRNLTKHELKNKDYDWLDRYNNGGTSNNAYNNLTRKQKKKLENSGINDKEQYESWLATRANTSLNAAFDGLQLTQKEKQGFCETTLKILGLLPLRPHIKTNEEKESIIFES